MRVDLGIAAGEITARIAGLALPDEIPSVETFHIDPSLKPRTRSIEVIQSGVYVQRFDVPWIEVDSDAELLRVEWSDGRAYTVWSPRNDRRGDFSTFGVGARVTALYPDGTEQLVLDYQPPVEPDDESPLTVLVVLSALGLVYTRIAKVEAITF